MRNYELTLILSPDKSETETNDIFQNLIAFIQDKGGILEKQNITPKRKLGVPIHKKEQGVLAILGFNMTQEGLIDIEKNLKENKEVLRYMITIKPTVRAIKKRAQRRPAPAVSGVTATKEAPKIDTKDVDKELEEIFND